MLIIRLLGLRVPIGIWYSSMEKYQLKSRKWRRLCVEMRPRMEELCGLESADFQSCGCRVMQCWRSPSSVWSSCPKVAATICLPAVFTFWHWLMMIWISPPVSLPPTPSVETRLWSFYPRTIPLPFWGVRNPSPDVRSGAPKSGWNGWGETVRGGGGGWEKGRKTWGRGLIEEGCSGWLLTVVIVAMDTQFFTGSLDNQVTMRREQRSPTTAAANPSPRFIQA